MWGIASCPAGKSRWAATLHRLARTRPTRNPIIIAYWTPIVKMNPSGKICGPLAGKFSSGRHCCATSHSFACRLTTKNGENTRRTGQEPQREDRVADRASQRRRAIKRKNGVPIQMMKDVPAGVQQPSYSNETV